MHVYILNEIDLTKQQIDHNVCNDIQVKEHFEINTLTISNFLWLGVIDEGLGYMLI